MFFKLSRALGHSLRDFAREYLMVVVGVLTALALDQWVLHINRRQDASAASARIQEELRADIENIHKARKVDAAQFRYFDALRERVIKGFRAQLPDAEIAKRILASTHDIDMDERWPVLHHEAWDVAVADGSATWINNAQMRQYAAAYTDIRGFGKQEESDNALIMADSHLIAVMADLQTGRVQPREFLHTISQISASLHDTVTELDIVEKMLNKALAVDDPAKHSSTSRTAEDGSTRAHRASI